MIHTEPEVFLLAAPKIKSTNMKSFLSSMGLSDPSGYMNKRGTFSDAENLIEVAARGCYKSFEPRLNPNVTKIREDQKEYHENILRSGHGSVLEHAQLTFGLMNISRVATHEIVRHRAGVAISQESLRYVRLTDLGFRVPEILSPMEDRIIELVETLEEFQKDAAQEFGLDEDGIPFHYKKEVTSALRRLAPIGLSTNMVWSANIRTLRHVIPIRTHPSAEEEMRIIYDLVATIVKRDFPLVFQDLEKKEDGSWEVDYQKV